MKRNVYQSKYSIIATILTGAILFAGPSAHANGLTKLLELWIQDAGKDLAKKNIAYQATKMGIPELEPLLKSVPRDKAAQIIQSLRQTTQTEMWKQLYKPGMATEKLGFPEVTLITRNATSLLKEALVPPNITMEEGLLRDGMIKALKEAEEALVARQSQLVRKTIGLMWETPGRRKEFITALDKAFEELKRRGELMEIRLSTSGTLPSGQSATVISNFRILSSSGQWKRIRQRAIRLALEEAHNQAITAELLRVPTF